MLYHKYLGPVPNAQRHVPLDNTALSITVNAGKEEGYS